jgi:hypothetical protein
LFSKADLVNKNNTIIGIPIDMSTLKKIAARTIQSIV